MADRRGILLPLVIIGFFIFSPGNRPIDSRFQERPSIEDAIAEEERSLGVLQNSTYNDFWKRSAYGDVSLDDGPQLNLTGLQPDQGFAWAALPAVKKRVEEFLGNALGPAGINALGAGGQSIDLPPLYTNVTGYVHGPWVRSKLQDTVAQPHFNLSTYAGQGPYGPFQPHAFERNITGDIGDVSIRFHERTPHDLVLPDHANVTGISVEMTLREHAEENEAELQLYGIYNMDLGQAILTTTSHKMAGIFMLPHFALSDSTYEPAKAYLNQSISHTIQKRKAGDVESFNPWPSESGNIGPPMNTDLPLCELIVWLQQMPPRGLPATGARTDMLGLLEKELRSPTGAFLPPAPELRFNMIAFSPDCGYILESKGEPDFVPQDGDHLVGPKIESLFGNGRHHLMFFALIVASQIALLKRQMQEASTPSTRSRISFTTVAMLALGDGFATMTFLLVSLFVSNLWIDLMAAAFLAFVSVSFFGMRFMFDIWTAHAPERERAAREEAEEERQRRERLQVALNRISADRNERLRQLAERQEAQTASGPPTDAELAAAAVNPPSSQQEVPSAEPVANAETAPPASNVSTTEEAQPAAIADTTAPTGDQPAAAPSVGTSVNTDTLPLPATARRPPEAFATPPWMPSDQAGIITQTADGLQVNMEVEPQTSTFGSLYMRFYLVLLGVLFVSLNATGWPTTLRRFYFTTIALLYLSFWIPQIIRNVQRNSRKAFRTEFVLGQSALRLLPFTYFYAYKHNVLFASQDYYSLAILAIWIWIQIIVITSQEIIGPRWFVRKDWVPPAYNYHPVLRADEEGATLPLGLSDASNSSVPTSPLLERRVSLSSPPIARRASLAATKEHKEKGKRVYDCAICFQDLEVPVIEADGGGENVGTTSSLAGGLLARRNYMVTPCRHIFHSACLEGWMKYRLQCPICREGLPPL